MKYRLYFAAPLFGTVPCALCAAAITFFLVGASFLVLHAEENNPLTKKLLVSGAALALFVTDAGTPPNKVILADPLAIKAIENQIASLWLTAVKVRAPKELASSFHLDLKLSDGRKATLLAGRYCLLGGEWRESQMVKDVQDTIIKIIPRTGRIRWATGALNTTYPSDEEKLEILNRMIKASVRAEKSDKMTTPSDAKSSPAKQ